MTAAVGSSQFPFPSVGSEDDEALLLLICGARVSEFVSSIVASDLCGRGEGFFFHHGAETHVPQAPLLCHQVEPDASRQNSW